MTNGCRFEISYRYIDIFLKRPDNRPLFGGGRIWRINMSGIICMMLSRRRRAHLNIEINNISHLNSFMIYSIRLAFAVRSRSSASLTLQGFRL